MSSFSYSQGDKDSAVGGVDVEDIGFFCSLMCLVPWSKFIAFNNEDSVEVDDCARSDVSVDDLMPSWKDKEGTASSDGRTTISARSSMDSSNHSRTPLAGGGRGGGSVRDMASFASSSSSLFLSSSLFFSLFLF